MIAVPVFSPWSVTQGMSVAAWAALAAVAASASVVLLVVPPLRRFAWWTGYLDHPEARKLHLKATPLLGGVAVALGAIAGAGVLVSHFELAVPREAGWWGAGALGALFLGLVDDRFGMHPLPKLLLQIGVAGVFLAGGVYPTAGLGPWVGIPLGLFWIVAMMNAINFLDNMDGIVGGISAILASGLGVLLLSWGHYSEAIFAFALAGAALAFLRFNFSPASVFLGDAGSLFLGYSLGALSLLAAESGPDIEGSVAALLILGYPVFDLSFVVLMRLREGRKIYHGGKDHTTHRLSTMIGGPRRTALGVYLWAAALTASGVGVAKSEGFWNTLPWLILWGLALFWFGIRLARVPVPTGPAPSPQASHS
jgi:UDP-GlcNAc:undecaprenyl-phosphate GlcNAc-1-phosphate transferase